MFNPLPLKIALTVSFSILLNLVSGQDKDQPSITLPKPITTTGLSNFSSNKQKQWIKVDEVIVETINLALSTAEKELARAESQEIRALLKRDTAALKKIWLQNFTPDEPTNKVSRDPNPLPHYLSLHRRIEKITIVNNRAYVSGIEHAIQVNGDKSINLSVTRKYTHMWVKELFEWRLATKSYE